jgi:hypothetical protein
VEILDLRHFSSVDLRPLLDDETQVWSRLLSWDYTSSADMILRYVDAKILPGYAAVERGKIFGYAFFVYEGSKGVIGDLFVANGERLPESRAVEGRLLAHVIETLQQSPGIHRVEAQLLVHDAGILARPFLDQGFRRQPRLFMAMPLNRPSRPASSIYPDFEIRGWLDSDYQSAAAVITAAYRGHVDAEINDQYRTLSGSLRFLNNIVRFPGCGLFDPEASFVVSHRVTRHMVGLILC